MQTLKVEMANEVSLHPDRRECPSHGYALRSGETVLYWSLGRAEGFLRKAPARGCGEDGRL